MKKCIYKEKGWDGWCEFRSIILKRCKGNHPYYINNCRKRQKQERGNMGDENNI
jgi:hypothetical protein